MELPFLGSLYGRQNSEKVHSLGVWAGPHDLLLTQKEMRSHFQEKVVKDCRFSLPPLFFFSPLFMLMKVPANAVRKPSIPHPPGRPAAHGWWRTEAFSPISYEEPDPTHSYRVSLDVDHFPVETFDDR